MTDDLMALLAKATAGEWLVRDDVTPWANWICGEGGDADICEVGEGWTPRDMPEAEANAAAIVASVNFCRAELPALIEREAALREALRAVLDGHGCQPGYLSHSALQIARAALESTRHDSK